MTVFQMLNNSRDLDAGIQNCDWWVSRHYVEVVCWAYDGSPWGQWTETSENWSL